MKVSVVAGVCCKADAISESVVGTIRAVMDRLNGRCRLYTYSCDVEGITTITVNCAPDVVLNTDFIDSDIIIYHFGIYCELFNSILLGNGHARQIVYYHNITPREYTTPARHITIEKSLRQRANLDVADEIWTASDFSRDSLIKFGIPGERIRVIPLYVKPCFAPVGRAEKASDVVRVIAVGRFVPAKGLIDLIRAVAVARSLTSIPFKLALVGNTTFSDHNYVVQLKQLWKNLGLDDIVELVPNISDDELWARYRRAHIFASASYHEGFCVPVIEAMRARCLPITYDSGNLPDIVGGFGEVVARGEHQSLGCVLARYITFFGQLGNDDLAMLPLTAGSISVAAYDQHVERYMANFTYSRFCDRVVAALLDSPPPK